MKNTNTFSQSIVIKAARALVYDALTNGASFADYTGAPAEMSATPGATFSAYGGYLQGFVLAVKKSELLVQAFRTQEWSPGDFSLLRFNLRDEGSGATRVEVYHYGIPDQHLSSNEQVWEEFYWSKLRRALET